MRTVVNFPDQCVLAEEAAEWLIRLDADIPPSKQELRALGDWLHRSPAHREELENLAALWGRLNVLTELAVPLGKPGRSTADADSHSEGAAVRAPWLRQATVAAALVGAFALGLANFFGGPFDDSQTAANGFYATAVGQQTTTVLPDGSQIVLNTNTQIRVDYDDHARALYLLQGEALFSVAKDGGRPFRVYAGNGRVQALGTAFSVYIKDGDVQVTVAEGHVDIASVEPQPLSGTKSQNVRSDGASPGRSAPEERYEPLGTLSAGQVAMIRNPEETLGESIPLIIVTPLPPRELEERLAWRDGILTFSGDPLEEVVREIGRYTTVSIEIPDPAIRQLRIGGRFPVGETEAMLRALETNFHLRVTRLGHNRVILTAAEE